MLAFVPQNGVIGKFAAHVEPGRTRKVGDGQLGARREARRLASAPRGEPASPEGYGSLLHLRQCLLRLPRPRPGQVRDAPAGSRGSVGHSGCRELRLLSADALPGQGRPGKGGLLGLLPRRPGPRRAHKLTAGIVGFLEQARAVDPTIGAKQLACLTRERFGLVVHPRSVERALARQSSPTSPTDDGPRHHPGDSHPSNLGGGPEPRCVDEPRVERLCQLYEELRTRAVGRDEPGTRPLGQELFLRQGMSAWLLGIAKCSETSSIAPSARSIGESGDEVADEAEGVSGVELLGEVVPIKATSDGEMAVVLANMALAGRSDRTDRRGGRA